MFPFGRRWWESHGDGCSLFASHSSPSAAFNANKVIDPGKEGGRCPLLGVTFLGGCHPTSPCHPLPVIPVSRNLTWERWGPHRGSENAPSSGSQVSVAPRGVGGSRSPAPVTAPGLNCKRRFSSPHPPFSQLDQDPQHLPGFRVPAAPGLDGMCPLRAPPRLSAAASHPWSPKPPYAVTSRWQSQAGPPCTGPGGGGAGTGAPAD